MKKAIMICTGSVLGITIHTHADVFASDSPLLLIPDNDPANAVITDIVITDDESIKDLNVGLWVDHTWQGDLVATLEHVDTGTVVTLLNRPGSTIHGGTSTVGYDANDFGTSSANPLILDDDISGPSIDLYAGPLSGFGTGTAGYAGPANPTEPLSGFDGESTMGTWRLVVSDNASGDIGQLHYWELSFASNPIPCQPVLAVFSVLGLIGSRSRRH